MIKNKLKKILIMSMILSSSFILTSCEIPFERFLGNDTAITKELPVEGINATNNTKTIEDVQKYKDKLNSIFSVIGDNDFYLKNFNNKEGFYKPIKSFFNDEYLQKVINGESKNVFGKVVDNIYYIENTKFKEMRIIGIGENLETTKVELEIVSIDDTTSFGVQYIDVFFDKSDLITDVTLISDLTTAQNTTKEIDTDSLLEGTNAEFIKAFESFILPLKNKTIYNLSLSSDTQQDFDYEINVVIDDLELENKNSETLKTLFKAGKTTFDNYGIIEYMNYDRNAVPITTYKVRFSLDGEYIDFNINYNRLDKTIEKIYL